METRKFHKPVLLKTIDELISHNPKIYLDATLGGGGHFFKILERGHIERAYGIDKDMDSISYVLSLLREDGIKLKKIDENMWSNDRIWLIHSDFEKIDEICDRLEIEGIDLILADLGVSSHQLDTASRGFSFRKSGPLDMRMDKSEEVTAGDLLNSMYQNELEQMIRKYGEERYAKRIAKKIVEYREQKQIQTTDELFTIIKKAVPSRNPASYRKSAQRVFQALRILRNNELAALSSFLPRAFERLNFGGRMGLITFHSLEDRIVKNFVKELRIPSKLILPSKEEVLDNPRSRSAKMRILCKEKKEEGKKKKKKDIN